jgi:GxxExxY protein
VSNAASSIEKLISDAIDCGFSLHSNLGPGLLESAYEVLLEALLRKRGYCVERQKPISLQFEDISIQDVYRVDLLVEKQLIIELKSIEQIAPVHSKQLLTYLRVTGLPVGLIMNFGGALFKDGVKRIINNRSDYVAAIENATWHRPRS